MRNLSIFRHLKRYKDYSNSFWLTFFCVMVLNQIALFFVFYLVAIKPTGKDMSQLFGATMFAAHMIDEYDPEHGLSRLQEKFAEFPSVTIEKGQQTMQDVPWQLFGLKAIKAMLESLHGDTILVGYDTSRPNGNQLVIQSKSPPYISIRVFFSSKLVAQKYIEFSLFMVLVMSFWASMWISNRIVNPLEKLSKKATEISLDTEHGKISVDDFVLKELKQLAISFNKMQQKIHQFVQDRETLLSGVTHDIRTPLSRMRLALELDKSLDNGVKNELLEDILEMNDIIQQFNELAKLNLEIAEKWEVIDLNQLLMNIQAKYQRSNVNLKLNLSSDLTLLRAKPVSLNRLLYNLIDNAYRHGTKDVTVSTYQTLREILVSVSNPVVEQFAESVQSQDPIFNHRTGLGLKIVQSLAKVHNATITESTLYGVREYRLSFSTKQLPPPNTHKDIIKTIG